MSEIERSKLNAMCHLKKYITSSFCLFVLQFLSNGKHNQDLQWKV